MNFLCPLQAIIPGAQGHILAVLVSTSTELNLRAIARLGGISPSQVSHVLPKLVELGLVRRREVPPSSLFALNQEHVSAAPLIELSRAWDRSLLRIGEAANTLVCPPQSLVVFGSLAIRQAGQTNNVNLVLIRPNHVQADELQWAESINALRDRAHAITGSVVDTIILSSTELQRLVTSKSPLWAQIVQDGVVVYGAGLGQCVSPHTSWHSYQANRVNTQQALH